MPMVESMLAKRYEELANHFARQGESRPRDQCLVLAADAALAADQPAEAERLRKRLLLTNPHHMLRPYFSMAEAMESPDIRDFVVDLRKQWPPETVAKLLNVRSEPAPPAPYALEPPPLSVAEARPPARVAADDPAEASDTSGLALLLFGLGVALTGLAAFAAFGAAFME